MSGVSQEIDRLGVVFEDEGLVADAGLLTVGTLMGRLGLEGLVDETVRLGGRRGGARPGGRVLSLVAAMLAGPLISPAVGVQPGPNSHRHRHRH